MHARVTAVLVARNGAAFLDRTLAALARQTRAPEQTVMVDAGSSDSSAELLAAAGPTQFVQASARTFGAAIERGLHVASGAPSNDEWLWLLAHDNAPDPRALERLLAAVEIAPSVAIAGPKLMRWDQADVIAGFGETLTRYGASIPLVDGELDQAQHDVQDDVMGVAAQGMLVRRSVWTMLGGFDPGLPSIDAGLDLSIRARLAGFRVVVVPEAKVASAGGPERFGRRSSSERRRATVARTAQLHRRMVYAPGGALLFHWLSLVPFGLARALGQLLAKHPAAIGGEIAAAFAVAFGATGVGRARAGLRRTRRIGWAAVDPLRMPSAEVRERRGQAREDAVTVTQPVRTAPLASFAGDGGLAVVIVAAIVGLVAFAPLLGSSALGGGGLLPLSGTVGELWSHVGYGSRDVGAGTLGPADPFAVVLAVLGSLTFWAPPTAIVVFFLVALPLSALGAWFAARRLTTRRGLPALTALLWAVAPPLLGSLDAAHLGSAIAHVLLPWLVVAALAAPRSWTAAAGSALLFAGVTASAPVLAPALVLCWLAWLFSHPKSAHLLVGIPIPAAALFAPLVVAQLLRGTPLGIFAEPGVPAGGATHSGWHLALGAADDTLHGWGSVVSDLGLSTASAPVVVAVLVAPIGVLAMLALFVRGSRRAIPALVVALLGYLTAVAAAHLEVTLSGATAVAVWPGAALSLFWLGLVGGMLVALDGVGRASVPLATLAGVTSVLLAVPLLAGLYLNTSAVTAASRVLPAVVTAEAVDHPTQGTLVLQPQKGGALSVRLERGSGTTLDDQSTLVATDASLSADRGRIAVLAGNLVSPGGYDPTSDLHALGVRFVLLAPSGDAALRQRASAALDGRPEFVQVGPTPNGQLWQFTGSVDARPATAVSNTGTPLGVAILVGQGIVFAFTLLLGIPTVRRRRRGSPVSGARAEGPATTFDGDDDD